MERGSLAAAWNNALLPVNVDVKVHRTLSYAPRGLRCSWRDCSCVDDPFDSLQALIQHTKMKHVAPQPASPLGSKRLTIRCLSSAGCKYVCQTNDDLLRHFERAHWEPIRSRCYLCEFQDSKMLVMVTHLEKRHGIPYSAHPIKFFGQPPRPPRHPWPFGDEPIPTCFALMGPVSPDPSTDPFAPAVSAGTIPTGNGGNGGSRSSLRAAWDSAYPPGTATPSTPVSGATEEEQDEGRYEFLDDDIRVADLMIFNAPNAKGGPYTPVETNILLATDAKPVPFPPERPPEEPTASASNSRTGGGADTTMTGVGGKRRLEEGGESAYIGGETTAQYGPFYAVLRTPPKGRIELSVGFPYKLGEPVVPKSPPPVRGNFLEQRKEILEELAKRKNADVTMG